jgi:hypothetical protein
VHHTSLLAELKRKLRENSSPPVRAPLAEEFKPRRTPEELKRVLRDLGPRPGEPVFDFHGFCEITSKCIDPLPVKPEDLVLHLPKGTRTRKQCNEVLSHPATVWKCNKAKKDKKEATRSKKRGLRDDYEASVKRNGGTIGNRCKRGTRFTIGPEEVDRRSEAMTEYNATCAYFRSLFEVSSTTFLPPPSKQGVFRKGAEALAYEFTLGQLLPSIDLIYVETSLNRRSEVACTWAGKLTDWERDFDITFGLGRGRTLAAQLQCKGFLHWYKPLYKTLASSDYDRGESSAPFLYFFKTFRRMSHFAIRHCVNLLQGKYQSDGTYRPIFYLSFASLKQWLADGLRLDSAEALLALYEAESDAFWRRFSRLFQCVFPREWGIIEEAFLRTGERCAGRHKIPVPLSAKEIAVYFASYLREVKAEAGYRHDREALRLRFIELYKEVNDRSRNSRMTREQALYHMLPRKPRRKIMPAIVAG